MVESGMTLDLAQLVIDDEIIEMTKFFCRGIAVNDDEIKLDEIQSVGPAGNFIELDSTLKGARLLTSPRLIDRKVREAWVEDGSPDFYQKALREARRTLAEHEVEPLDADVLAEMHAIVMKADATYANSAARV
jgi:trimethylamine--corrinoid protein Co-methyltransferase